MGKLVFYAIAALLLAMGAGANASSKDKVTLCHKGDEIRVSSAALGGHLNHGDELGDCDDDDDDDDDNDRPDPKPDPEPEPDKQAVVAMLRCEGQPGGAVLVVSISTSLVAAVPLLHEISPRDDCAIALASLLDAGLSVRTVTGGSAEAGDGKLHLYSDYLLVGRLRSE